MPGAISAGPAAPPSPGLIDEDQIIRAMTPRTALVVLPSVLYRSGQLLDLERLAAAARERGIPLGLDCSHSAGIVPHRLADWGVDFAFWCGYKWLGGGPRASWAPPRWREPWRWSWRRARSRSAASPCR